MIAKRHKKSKCPDSDMIVLTIMGEPASKANARRLVKIKKRYAFIKSKKALSYSRNFEVQCPVSDTLYEEDLAVAMKIYYKSRRPDLDESLILDLLQGKAYKNDRAVKIKYIEWGLDREVPRTYIVLGPVDNKEEIISTLRELVEKEEANESGQRTQ
jgi:Holliday junction resolvase RusA-like endonuclease